MQRGPSRPCVARARHVAGRRSAAPDGYRRWGRLRCRGRAARWSRLRAGEHVGAGTHRWRHAVHRVRARARGRRSTPSFRARRRRSAPRCPTGARNSLTAIDPPAPAAHRHHQFGMKPPAEGGVIADGCTRAASPGALGRSAQVIARRRCAPSAHAVLADHHSQPGRSRLGPHPRERARYDSGPVGRVHRIGSAWAPADPWARCRAPPARALGRLLAPLVDLSTCQPHARDRGLAVDRPGQRVLAVIPLYFPVPLTRRPRSSQAWVVSGHRFLAQCATTPSPAPSSPC